MLARCLVALAAALEPDDQAAAAAAADECELIVSLLNCAAAVTDELLGAAVPTACRDVGALSVLGAVLRDDDSLDSAATNTQHNHIIQPQR